MKSFHWSTLALVLAILPLSGEPAPTPGPGTERIARALNLTETQRAAIQGIREKHRPDLLLRRDAVRQALAALGSALQDAATPEAQLKGLYDRAASARFEMMLARRSVHQEVQAVLTPGQREKAAELRGAAQERMHERRRHRREGAGFMG